MSSSPSPRAQPGRSRDSAGGRRRRSRIRRLLVVGVISGGSLTGLLLISGLRAYGSAHSGAALMADGIRLIGQGDVEAGDRQLGRAERAFESALSELDRWWLQPAQRLPVLNRQWRAAHALAGSGARLAGTGRRLAADAPVDRLRLVDGTIDTEAVARLEGPLEAGLVELRRAHDDLSRARVEWLLAPLDRRLQQATAQLRAGIARSETGVLAARVVPNLFGATGVRRYFLAIQTPAEPRASGGMIGNFGEMTTDAGRLRLERLGRTMELNEGGDPTGRALSGPPDYLARYERFQPDRTWQNVTMSPDFPSVAQVIDGLYPQSGGQRVDGVVAIDPFALAALLKLTGPVSVPGWPEPLTADNAADILLREQYLHFEYNERIDFLDATARRVFERLTTMSLPPFPRIAEVLGPAVRSRHLMLWSSDDAEQALFERAGATGALPEVRGDFLAAVVQDATGSKLGAFLRRSIGYRAVLDPDSGAVQGEAVVRLENQAPLSGLPEYVTGNPGGISPGEHRVYLSLYTPLVFEGATVDGRPLLMESQRERSRHVYSAFVTIPPGQSTTLVVRLAGVVGAGDEYRLDIARQPSVAPDDIDVEVRMGGRGVAAAEGLDVSGDMARGRFELSADRAIRLRAQSVAVTGPGGALQLAAVGALMLSLGAHVLRWRRPGWAWARDTGRGADSNGTLRRMSAVGETGVEATASRGVDYLFSLPDPHSRACLWCGGDITTEPMSGAPDGQQRQAFYCPECASFMSPIESANGGQESRPGEVGDGPNGDGGGSGSGPGGPAVPPPDDDGHHLVALVDATVARRLEHETEELLDRVDAAVEAQLERHREALSAEMSAALAACLEELKVLAAAGHERLGDGVIPAPTTPEPMAGRVWRAEHVTTAEGARTRAELVEGFATVRYPEGLRPRGTGLSEGGLMAVRVFRDHLRRYADDVSPRVESYVRARAGRVRQRSRRVHQRLVSSRAREEAGE